MKVRLSWDGRASDYVGPALFLIGAAVLLIGAARQPDFGTSNQSPGVFPAVVGVIAVLASLALVVETARRRAKENRAAASVGGGEPAETPATSVRRLAGVVAAVLGYAALMTRLHFAFASFAFLVLLMLMLRGASVMKAIVVALCAVAVIQLVFGTVFRVILP